MITMFQVNHREDPPPVLFLQHVLNEGQRIAVVLRLGVQAAVVDHEPPLTGYLLGDDEARRGPLGVARLKPASLDEVTEDLLHGLLPLAPKGKLPVSIHTRSCFSRILASPYGPRTGGGNTGFPLKKVSPYFCFSLALNAWILGQSSDSALAFPGTWTTELT